MIDSIGMLIGSRTIAPGATPRRLRARALVGAVMAVVVGIGSSEPAAIGQNVRPGGSPPPRTKVASPRAVLVEVQDETAEQLAGRQVGQFVMTPEMLEQWAYGTTALAAGELHRSLVAMEISQLDSICGLSTEQKRVLNLAGAGEMQRIRESLLPLHAKFVGKTYEQDKMGKIFQEISQIQSKMPLHRQPLDPSSLLFKLLATTLDDSQAERLSAWQADRSLARLKAQIAVTLAGLEQQIPLCDSQRQELTRLLEIHLKPSDDQPLAANAMRRGVSTLLPQIAALDPEVFESVFDEAQLAQWETIVGPHRRSRRTSLPGVTVPPGVRLAPIAVPVQRAANPIKPQVVDELNRQRQLLLDRAAAAPNADAPAREGNAQGSDKKEKENPND